MVLLSGEAGIGKSRLVEVLREHLGREPAMWLTFRCSPYHTNSALYPVIAHLATRPAISARRARRSAPRQAGERLAGTRLPLEEAVPLMAALLSVPLAARYPPLAWSPQAEAEDPGSPGRLAGRRGGAPAGAGRMGRPALGRSLDPGAAGPGPGPDAHRLAVHPADISPGVLPAVDPPLLSDPAHPDAPDAPAGRGDGAEDHGGQGPARPRWCSRSWPRPTGCRCLSKS